MDFKNAGKTILFCSHSMYQVEALCDRVVWLSAGEIRKVGKPVEVITEYSEMISLAAPREESLVRSVVKEESDKENSHDRGVKSIPAIENVEVSVDGKIAKVHSLISGESDLEITVRFRLGEGLPMPSVAIGISGGDGRILSSAGSFHDGISLSVDETGKGVANIVFPKLSLLRGHYYLDVALLCEKGIHLYESIRRAAELHIDQKGLERGFVMLPHEWKV